MTVDLKDLQIDVYRGGDCTVRVTHLPSGVTAEASDPSQLRAREEAMRELQRKLPAKQGEARVSAGCKPDSSGANWLVCHRGTVGCPYIHDGLTPHCIQCAAGEPCKFKHEPPALEMTEQAYREFDAAREMRARISGEGHA